MANTTQKTALHDQHVALQARIVDFAGWSMPIQYTSIVAEHICTRNAVGLFDISHMGRLRFDGGGAAALLEGLVTRRVDNLRPGRIRYALVTNERGTILDDVLVYHLQNAGGDTFFQMVVNASNRAKILEWLEPHMGGSDVRLTDQTLDTAMIAVQGPQAVRTADPLVEAEIAALKYYTGAVTRICGHPGTVSRTGYTGEDGCELVVAADAAAEVWQRLLEAGRPYGIKPVGLGARDTLRLEAAMPLYGHELSEEIEPFQAGLDFAVQLEDRTFPGRDALVAARSAPSATIRIGLEVAGRRVAREHGAVFAGEDPVGEVTSGTFSPTLGKPIAMAYVRREFADPGTELQVDIRGRRETATVVKMPFYSRSSG
jgi:aminomethyltransferase